MADKKMLSDDEIENVIGGITVNNAMNSFSSMYNAVGSKADALNAKNNRLGAEAAMNGLNNAAFDSVSDSISNAFDSLNNDSLNNIQSNAVASLNAKTSKIKKNLKGFGSGNINI